MWMCHRAWYPIDFLFSFCYREPSGAQLIKTATNNSRDGPSHDAPRFYLWHAVWCERKTCVIQAIEISMSLLLTISFQFCFFFFSFLVADIKSRVRVSYTRAMQALVSRSLSQNIVPSLFEWALRATPFRHIQCRWCVCVYALLMGARCSLSTARSRKLRQTFSVPTAVLSFVHFHGSWIHHRLTTNANNPLCRRCRRRRR